MPKYLPTDLIMCSLVRHRDAPKTKTPYVELCPKAQLLRGGRICDETKAKLKAWKEKNKKSGGESSKEK